MQEIVVATRRKGERRNITDRRSERRRRVVSERRLAARRQKVVPVEVDRRRGVERRARAHSTLPVRTVDLPRFAVWRESHLQTANERRIRTDSAT